MQADVLSGDILGNQDSESHSIPESNEPLHSLARFASSPYNSRALDVARPKCLLPESLRNGDGVGPVMSLDDHSSKLLVVTLGITEVVERMGLTVSVWGSSDQVEWGAKALVTFRQRQYCGVYSVLLNLAMRPEVQYLRVQWSMHRWGKGERTPLFGFEVFLEESGARVRSTALA